MRALPLLFLPFLLFLLSACSPTMDEIFIRANNTGDWTVVNERFDAEEQRGPARCRDGLILICGTSQASTCICESTARFYERYRESPGRRGDNHRY
jgi:hypothetical protein